MSQIKKRPVLIGLFIFVMVITGSGRKFLPNHQFPGNQMVADFPPVNEIIVKFKNDRFSAETRSVLQRKYKLNFISCNPPIQTGLFK
ncbi:MAG: hypothetical protein AAB019_04600, partial [Planctomycetota bacterium]